MPVEYEWDVEETDRDGEIIDHHFCDNLAEARATAKSGSPSVDWHIVLICRVENYDRGTTEVSWAYKIGRAHV